MSGRQAQGRAAAIAIVLALACSQPRNSPAPSLDASATAETAPSTPEPPMNPSPDVPTEGAAGPELPPPPGEAPEVAGPPDLPGSGPPDVPGAPTCGSSDGVCPAGCAAAADADCRRATGAACTGPTDCMSGFCADGVCCASACTGACESCVADRPGQCAASERGRDDPPSCRGLCAGRGSCAMLDQVQRDWSGGNGSIASNRYAQTFTASRAGALAAVRLQLGCPRGSVVRIEVTETVAGGRPGGRLLATGQTLVNDASFALQTFLLEPQPQLSTNQRAAITMRSDADCKTSMYGSFEMIDAYPPGARFTQDASNNWVDERDDMVFEIWLLP